MSQWVMNATFAEADDATIVAVNGFFHFAKFAGKPEIIENPDGSVLIRPKPERWTLKEVTWRNGMDQLLFSVLENGVQVCKFYNRERAQEYVDWQNSKEQSNG